MSTAALSFTQRITIRGGGKNPTFWNYVNEIFPRQDMETKHLVGAARAKFAGKLVGTRKLAENSKDPRVKRVAKREYDKLRRQSVALNLRFILTCAAKYSPSIPIEKFGDLIQECVIGWYKSLENFDPEKGAITTHAAAWIYQVVQRTMFNDDPVHVPQYIYEKGFRLEKGAIVSLDNPLFKDHPEGRKKSGRTFEDYLVDEDAIDPASFVEYSEVNEIVRGSLSVLSPKELEVITRRFGLNGGKPEGDTLNEIGADLGYCRERVRQIEAMALDRLRQRIGFRVKRTTRLTLIQGGGE